MRRQTFCEHFKNQQINILSIFVYKSIGGPLKIVECRLNSFACFQLHAASWLQYFHFIFFFSKLLLNQ